VLEIARDDVPRLATANRLMGYYRLDQAERNGQAAFCTADPIGDRPGEGERGRHGRDEEEQQAQAHGVSRTDDGLRLFRRSGTYLALFPATP
jgi:hypothetical protein